MTFDITKNVEITFDENYTRRLDEALEPKSREEGQVHDAAIKAAEDQVDEPLRRLIQAKGQLAQARLCYRGLPTQALLWAYQAADNSMHAALLADGKKPKRNHQKKLAAFIGAFPKHAELREDLDRLCAMWMDVRYERTLVSRETAHGAADLAYDVFNACCDIVATCSGIEVSNLRDQIQSTEQALRVPLVADLGEEFAERIEQYCLGQESRMETMGLGGPASQLAHGGRDIWLDVAVDQDWARETVEADPHIAGQLATLYTTFHKIQTIVLAHRLGELFEEDPNLLNNPELYLSAADFNLTCVISYSGLAGLNEMRRLISVSRGIK